MSIFKKVLVGVVLFFSLGEIAKADIAPPTKLTTFYFHENGEPVTTPVSFNIKCFGERKISELSEVCPSYGCQINTSNLFEVYKKNIKYCSLEGLVNKRNFSLDNFLGDGLTDLNCHRADFNIYNGEKYYKETPQYKSCQKDVYREFYPQGNGEVKGDYLCSQYKTDDKLIPTNLSPEPNGPCYRYGYTIKDNTCYQIPQSFSDCTARMDSKMKLCNQYLDDVTEALAKDRVGRPFDEICEARVNIDSTVAISADPVIKQKNIFSRIIDYFKCAVMKIFGKSCSV